MEQDKTRFQPCVYGEYVSMEQDRTRFQPCVCGEYISMEEQDRTRGTHFLVCVPSQNWEFCFFLRHRLHSERGQVTSATAINAVPVLEEVCAGTTRSGACGSI